MNKKNILSSTVLIQEKKDYDENVVRSKNLEKKSVDWDKNISDTKYLKDKSIEWDKTKDKIDQDLKKNSIPEFKGIIVKEILIIPKNTTIPLSSNDIGIKGEISFDDDYFYICISKNTWKRIALTSW